MHNKRDDNKRVDRLFDRLTHFIPAYKVLSDYINQFRGNFYNEQQSRYGRMIDHKLLIRSHATHACNIFASGLNSGMTNKSSQWFRLTVGDQRVIEIDGVRAWLDDVRDAMYSVINRSNIYDAFYNTYFELGQFGTGCFIILPDIDDVVRARCFTAGEYMIGVNNKGVVDTFARKFEMDVRQCVQNFGLENCSDTVKSYYQQKNYDYKVKIRHLIEPNKAYVEGRVDNQSMPFSSRYWEDGVNNDEKYLRKTGYRRFRVVAPRWETITTDSDLGYGPAWHSLGTIKELQKTVKDKLAAQEKLHNPPTVEDASVEGNVNLLPGGSTKVTSTVPNSGVRPAYQISPNLDSFIELINDEKDEINRFFFVDMFLALINAPRNDRTATEVAAIEQEKMMMMGPALHRLDKEMLTPTLEIIYDDMLERGLIPEPPEAIQGMDIKIEYTSILAQAQKAVGITKVERVVQMGERLTAMRGAPPDILDFDEVMRQVNEMEGAPAKILYQEDELNAMRQQQAEAQAQQQQMEALAMSSKAAKDASQAQLGNNSVLDQVTEQVA